MNFGEGKKQKMMKQSPRKENLVLSEIKKTEKLKDQPKVEESVFKVSSKLFRVESRKSSFVGYP